MTKQDIRKLKEEADDLFYDLSNAIVAERNSKGEGLGAGQGKLLASLTTAKRFAWECQMTLTRAEHEAGVPSPKKDLEMPF